MPPVIPTATYRLQLTPQFGFDQAAAVVPYLKALGISHLYASPFLKARSGSTHGYDIIDHAAFNPEFGGEPAFLRMSDALIRADMGLILDFVPNHMAVHSADNAWWLDVLEWGPRSRYAKYFDIDWEMSRGLPRVLLPILGRSYGEVLESGELELRYDADEGSFSVWYYEHRLPVGPNRYGEILQKVVTTAGAGDEPAGRALLALAGRHRGPRNPSPELAPDLKRDLAAAAGGAAIIERGLRAYRPASGEPGAVTALHYLLERQHYRPAWWRLAGSDINYRRFFDINTLAGLRVEEHETFDAIHRLVFRLIEDGRLQGLRLDHIDGIRDPHQYFRRLQHQIKVRAPRPLYLVVEKILGAGEALPRFANVSGTTGYEWLNLITHLLVDPSGCQQLDRTWQTFIGGGDFPQVFRQAKQRVLRTMLLSEFTVLARLLARIAAGHYSTRDYTAQALREALELFILNFPVYRTYVRAADPSANDRAIISDALDRSRAEWVGPDVGIFDFLNDALTLDLVAPGRATHSKSRVRRFAFKVQQFTGPMMAKSLEDTAFYRYHANLALNEVGGEAEPPALSLRTFHERMAARQKTAPHGLTATATHDTKRGEDARTRLMALSELAGEWETLATRWRELNAPLIARMSEPQPTAAHQYMLYQAMLGGWPLEGLDPSFVARVKAYAVKAAREGKEQTNWLVPNEAYERNLTDFVQALCDEHRSRDFIESFSGFARRCGLIGALNSLTQVTLKLTMPGVPDLYQGTELWDLSFVDPDNRRAVDFEGRSRLLHALVHPQGSRANTSAASDRGAAPNWPALARDWQNGHIKLALTRWLLSIRNDHAELFRSGDYRPVPVSGPHAQEIVAFARRHGGTAIIVVAARHFARTTQGGTRWPQPGDWNATLDLGDYRGASRLLDRGDAIDIAASVPAARLLHHPPVAILRATCR